MVESKWRRILGSLGLFIVGAVTTAYSWVAFLAGGPLYYGRRDIRDFGRYLGPFFLVLGIGVFFLRPWEEAQQAQRRGGWIGRLKVPPRWVRLVLVAALAAAANAAVLVVLYMLR
jgi:hypothetical protein